MFFRCSLPVKWFSSMKCRVGEWAHWKGGEGRGAERKGAKRQEGSAGAGPKADSFQDTETLPQDTNHMFSIFEKTSMEKNIFFQNYNFLQSFPSHNHGSWRVQRVPALLLCGKELLLLSPFLLSCGAFRRLRLRLRLLWPLFAFLGCFGRPSPSLAWPGTEQEAGCPNDEKKLGKAGLGPGTLI